MVRYSGFLTNRKRGTLLPKVLRSAGDDGTGKKTEAARVLRC
ncbi:hypothetical protein ACFFW8_23820 [Erwinia tracheiphila]